MKVLLYLAGVLALSASKKVGSAPTCVQCLHPIWYRSVAVYKEGDTPCGSISLKSVFSCLDTCDMTPADKPQTYRIRQLTQISDIFTALLANNCSLAPNGDVSVASGCDSMLRCVLTLSNYEYENRKTHSPFSTVFDYNCTSEVREQSKLCVRLAASQCVTSGHLDKISSLLSLGMEAACDNPRRCVKYGNIFEVNPGTQCREYFQEAAAYGPSLGVARPSQEGLGFDTVTTCDPEYLTKIRCPADPQVMPIFTEFAPTTTRSPLEKTTKRIYEPLTVDTSLPCEQCLYPVWHRAVTTNGSHLCDERFQALIYQCLSNCKCCPRCKKCPGRYEQYETEVLVKLADINKALKMNQCTGNPSCSAASYNCTEHMARFIPKSAPHVTVNTFSCRPEDLKATVQCFTDTCKPNEANLMTSAIIAGYDPICLSKLRCVTFGNIYEYVYTSEVNATAGETVEPCAYYRQAPVNGWRFPVSVNRVTRGLLFGTERCYADWPGNVKCPGEVGAADPMLTNPDP